ncbi:hypothetical protein AURDEDRAFT_115613 [Auricularia subglabra TFB-10046 SS5]|nr:hypothetical protein AURDEDRAFT_115613 [Auricularia subglabra TFB-10046 SS5]
MDKAARWEDNSASAHRPTQYTGYPAFARQPTASPNLLMEGRDDGERDRRTRQRHDGACLNGRAAEYGKGVYANSMIDDGRTRTAGRLGARCVVSANGQYRSDVKRRAERERVHDDRKEDPTKVQTATGQPFAGMEEVEDC